MDGKEYPRPAIRNDPKPDDESTPWWSYLGEV